MNKCFSVCYMSLVTVQSAEMTLLTIVFSFIVAFWGDNFFLLLTYFILS